MDYPLSLEWSTLAKCGQCVVPAGQHRGKTFEHVVDCGASARYLNRVCSSQWARSLCAYVRAVNDDGCEIVRGRDLDGQFWMFAFRKKKGPCKGSCQAQAGSCT